MSCLTCAGTTSLPKIPAHCQNSLHAEQMHSINLCESTLNILLICDMQMLHWMCLCKWGSTLSSTWARAVWAVLSWASVLSCADTRSASWASSSATLPASACSDSAVALSSRDANSASSSWCRACAAPSLMMHALVNSDAMTTSEDLCSE